MNNTGKKKKTMSNYNWCHGPNCHTKKTQDRIRGVKGNKVLRTRKIKGSDWYGAIHLGIGFVVIIANKISGICMVHR
jgi:hypothetical protein